MDSYGCVWARMYGASPGAGPYYGATGMEQQALAPYQVGISNSLHMYSVVAVWDKQWLRRYLGAARDGGSMGRLV